MTVSERDEHAFLDYVLELARREVASHVRQDKGETTKDGPEGPREEG